LSDEKMKLSNREIKFSALSPAPSCPVIQKKMTSSRKGYRVRLLRLTEADIWKAEHGIDLPAIIDRYKGQVKKLDKTELGKKNLKLKPQLLLTCNLFSQQLKRKNLKGSHR
jgi:hypothetical protein